jgi:hypothetical protein
MVIKACNKLNPKQATFTLATVGLFANSEDFQIAVYMFDGYSDFGKDCVEVFLLLCQWLFFRSIIGNECAGKIRIYS